MYKTCTQCKIEKPVTDFFTEKRGRYGIRSKCKSCMIKNSNKWKKENPEKAKQISIKANGKYRRINHDILKVSNRKAAAKWYRENPKKQVEKTKIYRAAHPEKVRAWKYTRRVLESSLSSNTVKLVYESNIKQFGMLTCYLCFNPIPLGKDHLEHKIPLSRGGDNNYNNLGVSCEGCNCSKGKRTVEEFLGESVPTQSLCA